MTKLPSVLVQRHVPAGLYATGLAVAAALAGLILPTSPGPVLALSALSAWVVLCMVRPESASFLVGLAGPTCYLFSGEEELFDLTLTATYTAMIIHGLVQITMSSAGGVRSNRLALAIVAWAGYIYLMRNMSRVSAGTWDLKYLLVSGFALAPYCWALLSTRSASGPSIDRAVFAGIITGTVAVGISFLFNFQPWGVELTGMDARARTFTIIGSLRNSLGLVWVVGVALLLGWEAGRWRPLKVVLLAILISSIAYSFSRSSYFALVVVLVANTGSKLSHKFLFVSVLAAAGMILTPDSVWERVFSTWAEDTGFDPSSAARIVLWQAATSAFALSPIWGIGMDSFTGFLWRSGFMGQLPGDQYATYAYSHNYFLTLLSLTGVLGGVLAILVFWESLRVSQSLATLRAEQYVIAVRGGITAFLLCSLFGEPLFDPVLLIVFLQLATPLLRRSHAAAPSA